MSAVTLNTGNSASAVLAWDSAAVTPPDLTGRNFIITFPMIWKTPTTPGDYKIFAIPSSSGSGGDAYAVLAVQWTNSGTDALQVILTSSAGATTSQAFTSFDGITTLTPALLVIRGVASGSDTVITMHAEVYGETAETPGSQVMTGAPAASTADGDFGWMALTDFGSGGATMLNYTGDAITDISVIAPFFRTYASAGATPTLAAVVASVKANIGNIFGSSAFGSPSATVAIGLGYTEGNSGGTVTFTNYSLGTVISSSNINVLCVRNAAGSSINQIRYDAVVSGTHLVVNPFALSASYVELTVTDPVSGHAPTGAGTAAKLSRYRAGVLARLNTCIVGQSWASGQASSPLTDIEAGLGCGNDFTQGYIAANRATVVGMRSLRPIQSAATVSRQQQYRLGDTTTDSNGLEDTYVSNSGSGGTGTNYADWYEWGHAGSGGVNTGNPATTGASSLGGYPIVGSYTDSANAELQSGFDLTKFSRISASTAITVEAGGIRYGGGPVAVVISGETRSASDIHGTSGTAASASIASETVSYDNGEGTARDLVSVSNSANTATIVFDGVEADITKAEVDASNADAAALADPDLPRWVAYIHDTVTGEKWLKPIRTATWSSGTNRWTITCKPAFHVLPTAASTTKVRCSHWSLVFGSAAGIKDDTNNIRGVRVRKTGASGGGPMVFPVIGWRDPSGAGEIVSNVGTGGYVYSDWDSLNVPGLFARMMDAMSLDCVTMMNTAVPIGAGNYEAAIDRFQAVSDSVIGVYVPAFQTSFTDASPLYDATSRTDFRLRCFEAGIPWYDLVIDGGHAWDNTLKWRFQDPTHFSALGYYDQATRLTLAEGTLAIHTSTSSGRTRGRSRTRGALHP